MSREKLVQLKNGTIALEEYGDPAGSPVIFCHGWPSSRTMAELTDRAARELGLRIISPDRPGLGQSTLQSDRKLLDWPPLLEAMADHLGLGEFRMLAISGGAPYAYASGWALPDRVKAIAVVSGAPPIVELDDYDGLFPLYRWMLALHGQRPELLRKLFGVARPFASIKLPIRLRPVLLKLLQPGDPAILRDAAAFEVCFESQRRAWRGSVEGVVVDARIFAEPWGFSLEEVKVPVRFWHGKTDRTFALRIAEEIASRLPNCRARYIERAGHYSLPIRHLHEILQDLAEVSPAG